MVGRRAAQKPRTVSNFSAWIEARVGIGGLCRTPREHPDMLYLVHGNRFGDKVAEFTKRTGEVGRNRKVAR